MKLVHSFYVTEMTATLGMTYMSVLKIIKCHRAFDFHMLRLQKILSEICQVGFAHYVRKERHLTVHSTYSVI